MSGTDHGTPGAPARRPVASQNVVGGDSAREIGRQLPSEITVRSTRVSISGVPYAHLKSRGDTAAPRRWMEAVKKQTAHLPKVVHPCLVRVTFRLPPDKFPKDHPYGSDLDNLLKRFFDSLVMTVFSEAPGKDGIVISIEATKVKVSDLSQVGADLEIIEIEKIVER